MILLSYLGLSYLLGSVPSGTLLARWAGLGARGFAGLLALVDIAKGALPVFLATLYWPEDTLPAAMAGFAAVLGHGYSIFLRFRGGKGVGTALGALALLAPCAMLCAGVVGLVGYYAFRCSAVAALAGVAGTVMGLLLFGAPAPAIGAALFCAAMVVRRHRDELEAWLNA